MRFAHITRLGWHQGGKEPNRGKHALSVRRTERLDPAQGKITEINFHISHAYWISNELLWTIRFGNWSQGDRLIDTKP